MRKVTVVMILTAVVMVYSVCTAKANDLSDIFSAALGGAVYGQLEGKNTKSTLRGAGAGAAGQVAVILFKNLNGEPTSRSHNNIGRQYYSDQSRSGGQTRTTRTINTTERWQNGQFSGATQRETYNRTTNW